MSRQRVLLLAFTTGLHHIGFESNKCFLLAPSMATVCRKAASYVGKGDTIYCTPVSARIREALALLFGFCCSA